MAALSPKPYKWRMLALALVPTSIISALTAMLLDQILIELGVVIHPYFEAITAGVFAFVFSVPAVPILWRLGLCSLPQYFLGGLALIVPTTLITLFFIPLFSPVTLDITVMRPRISNSQVWAFSIYVRFARSAVLLPVHIFSFWLIYHKLMNYSAKKF